MGTTLPAAERNDARQHVSVSRADGLVGSLYVPVDAGAVRFAAVVVGEAPAATRELIAERYAAELARRGVLALAIDHRAEYEGPDLAAAITYLSSRDDARRGVAVVGVCTPGANVLGAAARDRRVVAVVSVAGQFVEPDVREAERVTAPTLIVHSNSCVAPDRARRVYGKLRGPRVLYWTDGSALDFGCGRKVPDAADAIADHFRGHLAQ